MKHQRRVLLQAWKKANSSGVTGARESMAKNGEEALVSGSDPCMRASRNTGTSVIQLQGNEFLPTASEFGSMSQASDANHSSG